MLNENAFTFDAKGAEALGKFKKVVLVAFNACAIKDLVKFPDLPELEVRGEPGDQAGTVLSKSMVSSLSYCALQGAFCRRSNLLGAWRVF